MRRNFGQVVAVSVVGTFLCSVAAQAQRAPLGNWTASGNDPGQSGWQKSESILTPENTSTRFKYLWKIKLGPEGKNGMTYSEPLLAPRLINAQGFKDIVFTGGTDTLYAVDSELGTLLWKKTYDSPAASGACATGISVAMEPPAVINFGARRPAGAPAVPPPAPAPPPSPGARRLGGSAGAGGFTLRAIYAITNDGMLHGQVLTTGADYGPPVKFLPAAGAGAGGLNMIGKTIYTVTAHNCGGVPNAVWAMDMTTESYPVSSYATQKGSALGLSGPTLTETAAYVVTGAGAEQANSVVDIGTKDMKALDWYTPSSGKLGNVTPVAFTYKAKKLIAAPGPDGTFVLLDGESLGGADHHTALSQTEKISSAKDSVWDSLAAWQDAAGNGWVLASVTGPVASSKFAVKNGAVTHGAVVAFRLEEKDGKIALTPEWVSQDMVNPSAPRIANGVVIALSQGDASTHATLLVLDAASGKQLFTSGNSVLTYSHLAGVSIGDSHVFFTTHDNTLYSFGIGIEH
jgi:outer membrane protein assembly factor BamB